MSKPKYTAEEKKEKELARKRAWRAKNKDKILKYNRRHWTNHKERVQDAHLRYRYGMTLAAFNSMLDGQGRVCAICGKSEWGPHGPCVDHDHSNGKIRGVVCYWCNMAIGMLKDDPDRAEILAGYLRREM